MSIILKAQRSAWLPLLILSAPLAGFGIFGIAAGATISGTLIACLGVLVACYNATAKLVMNGNQVEFRRFGLRFWTLGVLGTSVTKGAAGDFGAFPGYVFTDHWGKNRRVIATLFKEDDFRILMEQLEVSGGKIVS